MDRTLIYTIKDNDAGMTIRDYLRSRGYSRHILTSMKPFPDAVQKNSCHAYMSDRLSAGDCLRIILRETGSSDGILPADLPFPVLYEDEDLLIVNKPAGLPVHPSMGNFDHTLANGAAAYFARKNESFVFRCINRLDRDTTGLLILARNPLSAALLSEELSLRKIRRTYLAAVKGSLQTEGTICLPIARKSSSVIERCIDPAGGEHAVTHYKLLEQFPGFCLARLQLETGRTHQIRVHMAAIGHPLLGETLYTGPASVCSGDVSVPEPADLPFFGRQALHSWKLAFPHPVTGKPMQFIAPLPADFCSLLRETRRKEAENTGKNI